MYLLINLFLVQQKFPFVKLVWLLKVCFPISLIIIVFKKCQFAFLISISALEAEFYFAYDLMVIVCFILVKKNVGFAF